jgi:GTP-binding protein
MLSAENGERGMPNLCHGKNGEDLVLQVPSGTLVTDLDSGEVIFDLSEKGMKVLIAS